MINESKIDTGMSYTAGFVGYMSGTDWMHIGAIILLIARLVVDVPRAYFYIKGLLNGGGNKGA